MTGCPLGGRTAGFVDDAQAIVEAQIGVIESRWDEICDAAQLAAADRRYFWRRQFLNPYALEGL